MPILGVVASSTRQGQNVDTGAMFALQTVSVGSAGAASVEFTNIPNTYAHLQIRYVATKTTNGSLYLTVNNSTTGGLYSRNALQGDGTSCTHDSISGSNSVDVQCGNTAGNFGIGRIDILDYANTNKVKNIRVLTGRDNNGSGLIWFTGNLWNQTTTISSIKFTPDSTNLAQYSQFVLYGIKGA
jgi:hypothetical protein